MGEERCHLLSAVSSRLPCLGSRRALLAMVVCEGERGWEGRKLLRTVQQKGEMVNLPYYQCVMKANTNVCNLSEGLDFNSLLNELKDKRSGAFGEPKSMSQGSCSRGLV